MAMVMVVVMVVAVVEIAEKSGQGKGRPDAAVSEAGRGQASKVKGKDSVGYYVAGSGLVSKDSFG